MINLVKTIKSNKFESLVLLVFTIQLIFPQYSPALAANYEISSVMLPNMTISQFEDENGVFEEENQTFFFAPPKKDYAVTATYTVPITSYSSTVDQTDSTPCITANGFNLCKHNQEDVIAANFLPFGTKVRIPEYFGDRIFTVQDRMNARYYYRADIWMRDRSDALKWGLKYTKIEVVE